MNAHRRSVLPVLAAALPLFVAVRAGPDDQQRPGHNLTHVGGGTTTTLWSGLARKVRQDDGGVVLIPAPRPSTTADPTVADAEASASHSSASVQRPLFGAPGFVPGPGPTSYSYMVQVQPHPRSAKYRRRHKSSRLKQDTKADSANHRAHSAAFAALRAPRPGGLEHFEERPPFTGHTFQSFPFGPFNTPASFTHGNPLAGLHRKPADGDLGSSLFAERPVSTFTLNDAQRSPQRSHRPKAAKATAKERPTTTVEINTLGDPRRPNLGIVGVPGAGRYEPSQPHVREYDPYSGRFKMVATDDSHDSREAYRRPGASAEADSQHADEPLESYEVYESPEETPRAVAPAPMRGSTCAGAQRDVLAELLAPLLNAMRPACQAGRALDQAAKSERFASLHRPRAPPRRKQAKHAKQHMKRPRSRAKQREPYFEFRNPVHSIISGTPEHRGRALPDHDEHHADDDHDALMHEDADAEYLTMGDAERAALDDAEEQRLLGGRGDENVFAPYSVYRTVMEPDKNFKPSVRFPFEEERANLKDLVEQLG